MASWRSRTKIAGSGAGAGSIGQRHGSLPKCHGSTTLLNTKNETFLCSKLPCLYRAWWAEGSRSWTMRMRGRAWANWPVCWRSWRSATAPTPFPPTWASIRPTTGTGRRKRGSSAASRWSRFYIIKNVFYFIFGDEIFFKNVHENLQNHHYFLR